MTEILMLPHEDVTILETTALFLIHLFLLQLPLHCWQMCRCTQPVVVYHLLYLLCAF